MWRWVGVALVALLGNSVAQSDYLSSVKLLAEDVKISFWHGGATKKQFGETCDALKTKIKAQKKYVYDTTGFAGSCYLVTIISPADRKKETEWLANNMVARYTLRNSRTTKIGKQTYTIEEWTRYGQQGGLILAYEVTDPKLLRIVAIPVLKY